MTPDDVRRLFDYHYWATYRLLSAVQPLTPDQFTRDLGSSFPSVRDTLSHLQGSEWIWLSRLRGESPTTRPGPERFTDTAVARAVWTDTEAECRAIVGGLDAAALARVLEYRMLDGQPTSARIADIIQHMVNHGTYHRGQVTTMLRQLGATPPPSLDMITFFREPGR